jgi:type I restriction enzyme S subunit
MKEQKNTEIANGYKMTELGPLPQEWEVVRLGEVGEIKTGNTPSKRIKQYWENGIIDFVKPPDLQNTYIVTSSEKISISAIKKARIVKEGAILVSCIGNIGRVGYALKAIAFNQQINAIEPKKEKCSSLFLFYALQTQIEQIKSLKSITTVPIVSKSKFFEVKFPLPPLPEQRKIAAILSTVQKAIETEKTLIERTKELKKSMMQKLFTEGIGWLSGAETSQKQTEIGPIPENWEVVRLGEVCIFQGGSQPPKSVFTYEPKEGYVRLLQIRDYESDDYATYVPISSKLRMVSPEDVLIARYGASVGKILRGKYGAINVAIVKVINNPEKIDNSFLYYRLHQRDFQIFVKGLGGRAAQAGFNRSELNAFSIPLPPLPEQQAIADILSTIDQKIDHHTTKKQKLEELFRTLLHELMTARVRVNKINLDFLKMEE